MVVVRTVERLDVECDSGGLREGVEEMFEHLGVHLTEAFLREVGLPDEKWPPGDVERDPGQRLVHRRQRVGIAADAALFAQRLIDRLTDREAGILYRMMLVDMEIADGL